MAIATDGNISFQKLAIGDLDQLAVIAQSLDNQWVPPSMLDSMISSGRGFAEVVDERNAAMRTEYIRSLINASQTVINRAYILNNPVVYTDFLRPGADRDAFKVLLQQGVIVPFFFDEASPIQEPRFSVDRDAQGAWRTIAQETLMSCVRLSWDDEKNREYIRSQLITRFGAFVQQMNLLDFRALTRELALDMAGDDARDLRRRLGEMLRWAGEEVEAGRYVTRDNLYRRFLVMDQTEPHEGRFDARKPFAKEIKQLVDLDYNVNLADSLDIYPLTPRDSLRRSALQEWQALGRRSETVTHDEILDLLRRSAFAQVQEGLYLQSLADLNLADIPTVRFTEEWHTYAARLAELLRSPMSFNDPQTGAPAVLEAYVGLAQVITRVATNRTVARRTGRMAKWQPVVELVFEVAGAVLTVVFAETAVYRISGSVASKIGAKAAPAVMRLVIRGFTERGSKSRLGISVDVMRRDMGNAEREWGALVAGLRRLPGFQEAAPTPVERPANYEYQRDNLEY